MLGGLSTDANIGIIIGAVVTVGAGLYGAGRKGVKLIEFFVNVKDTVDLVAHEMKPNNGGSLRDALDRVDNKTTLVVAQLEALETRTEALERTNEILESFTHQSPVKGNTNETDLVQAVSPARRRIPKGA